MMKMNSIHKAVNHIPVIIITIVIIIRIHIEIDLQEKSINIKKEYFQAMERSKKKRN